MKSFIRLAPVLLFVLAVCICLSACEKKKKEGKVEVTEKQFTIRKEAEFRWAIDGAGTIRNTGETDLKNVVVTGYCRSCGEILVADIWYVSDYEKLPEQKNIINYLPVGAEEKFSFKDVAFYFNQSRIAPEKLPDNLEVAVVSFEVVEN